jgi:hypothetical protein
MAEGNQPTTPKPDLIGSPDDKTRRQLALISGCGAVGIPLLVVLGVPLRAIDVIDVRPLLEAVWAFIGPHHQAWAS